MLYVNPVFTVEGEDYTGDITALEMVQDVSQTVTKTLKPTRVYVDTDVATAAITVSVIQGSEFHEILMETDPGATLDCVMQVEPGVGKRKATFSVASMPPNWGGERGQTLISQITLNVIDQPVWSVSA